MRQLSCYLGRGSVSVARDNACYTSSLSRSQHRGVTVDSCSRTRYSSESVSWSATKAGFTWSVIAQMRPHFKEGM